MLFLTGMKEKNREGFRTADQPYPGWGEVGKSQSPY
jgi:hypothetical protein